MAVARRTRPFRLSRRTLLRGGSFALALPFLEAMAPRRAAADSSPTRALFVYFPSGYVKGHWPAGTTGSADFTLPPLARALDPWKKKLTLITGLANAPAGMFSEAGGLHARGTGCSLVCEPLATSGFAGAGISVDQILARALGQGSCLSSLVLGLPHEQVPTGAEEGYSAVYYNNVSYAGPRSPVQKVSSPADLFVRLVTCPGFGAPITGKRARFEQAVMAAVKDKANRLMACAGQADRMRLEEYFTSVSELERRFLPATPTASCPLRTQPPAVSGTTLAESASAMMELAVLALQCGLTRVGTLMLDGAFSRRNFGLPELGGANYIHGLSHGEIGGEEVDNPRWLKITALYFQLHAQLLARLDAIDDGGATLLDRTIVTVGSEFGDGSRHDPSALPFLIAGGAGRLRTGQSIAARPGTPVANAYLDVLQSLGIDRTSFGDSTGTIPGLRV